MHEYFLVTHRRLDEAEPAIVIPSGQRAVGAHERSLLAVWFVANRRQRMFRLGVDTVKLAEPSCGLP
jgi:hypothetical protein